MYSHVFNVVNDGGNVVAIDGQPGIYGQIMDVAGPAHWGPGVKWGFRPTFP
jgi:hypothetical protein